MDPSTPDITAMPRVSYTQSAGGGGTVGDGGTASTSSNTTISLVSDTPGAVVYYTTNGSTPDPRSSQTSRFDPGTPIVLSIPSPSPDNSAEALAIKATAIGPNLKPSLVMSATVDLQYPQAAAPAFSVTGGSYQTDQTLTMSTTTPGATISYTMVSPAGTAVTPVPGQGSTQVYTGPIVLKGPSGSWTISAIATAGQMLASAATSASYSVTYAGLATPVINPPTGTCSSDLNNVTISSGAGSTIWYTTDGTAPVPGSSPSIPSGGILPPITGGFSAGITVVNAVATENQMTDSPAGSVTYTFQAAAPTVTPVGGPFSNDQTVSMSDAPTNGTIHYTVNGGTPTRFSLAYAGPFVVSASQTIQAIAVRSGYLDSAVTIAPLTMQVGPPTFSLAGGTYPSTLSVTLSDVTSGSSIYYTTDGSTPTTASTLYTGSAVAITNNGVATTIRALAVRSGYDDSVTTSVTYLILIPPSGLTLGSASSRSINVSWNAVPGSALVDYVLVRSTDPGFSSTTSYGLLSTSFTDSNNGTGLSASGTYYYRILANYSGGASQVSPTVTGYTLDALGQPQVTTVTLPGLYPTPPTMSPIFAADQTPTATTPTGPALREGGYTFIPYSWDSTNSLTVILVAYGSNNQVVNQWTYSGVTRYVWQMSVAAGIVTILGQGGVPLTIPWTAIQQ